MRLEPNSIRCTAKTFHKRRCRNQVMKIDPLFCHRHSKDHAYRRCIAAHSRNGRPCNRKADEGSAFCVHHRPQPIPRQQATPMETHKRISLFGG